MVDTPVPKGIMISATPSRDILGSRSMVGQHTLTVPIGVRVPTSQQWAEYLKVYNSCESRKARFDSCLYELVLIDSQQLVGPAFGCRPMVGRWSLKPPMGVRFSPPELGTVGPLTHGISSQSRNDFPAIGDKAQGGPLASGASVGGFDPRVPDCTS